MVTVAKTGQVVADEEFVASILATEGTGLPGSFRGGPSFAVAGLSVALLLAQHGSGSEYLPTCEYVQRQTLGTAGSFEPGVAHEDFFGCVSKLVEDLIENEYLLEEEAAKLLQENLWDLYV